LTREEKGGRQVWGVACWKFRNETTTFFRGGVIGEKKPNVSE